jgi:hypothetical protein
MLLGIMLMAASASRDLVMPHGVNFVIDEPPGSLTPPAYLIYPPSMPFLYHFQLLSYPTSLPIHSPFDFELFQPWLANTTLALTCTSVL